MKPKLTSVRVQRPNRLNFLRHFQFPDFFLSTVGTVTINLVEIFLVFMKGLSLAIAMDNEILINSVK